MITLFSNGDEALWLEENFIKDAALFEALQRNIDWKQNHIHIFGKQHLEPRLTQWFGPPYRYSSIQWAANPFPTDLEILRKRLSLELDFDFNAVLLNYYRSGADGMGWHSDNEKEMNAELIASISLGAARKICFRSKISGQKMEFILPINSLLVMKNFQLNWQHSIPKSKKQLPPRINLTFRNIKID